MLKSPLPPDVTVTDRLQTVISEWKGAQDGHKLERLYQDCLDLVGQDRLLLPARIIPVKELDSDRLAHALRRYHLPLEYYLDTVGRFEAALVPIVREDRRSDSFLFVYEEDLGLADQVGLFAHAVGHLILNQQQRILERELPLDPDDGQIHTDRLDVLRYLDISENRNFLDRKVLEAFPKLAHLIEPPEDNQVTLNQAARELEPFLRRQGWVNQYIRTSYKYTRGRVIPNSTRRGRVQVIDALLRAAPVALPIAVVHVQRPDEEESTAVARVRSAAQQFCVPFAYLLTRKKEIIELNWLTGSLSEPRLLTDLPTREELRKRWFSALQLTKQKEIDALLRAYQPDKLPYYYQEAAINQAIIATLQARNGLRERRRILLTLATGTGKTQIAFQILWKLRQTNQVNNVLFLADRGYLLEQAQANTFGPFNDAIVRGMGEIDLVHHIVFGTYQWLSNVQNGQERYKGYPPDYFDVIIIDECHRGSAVENSDWRKVLEHFAPAVQIGLTATHLETHDVQTNKYFGPSVYTYTLSQGINDGFLAPYSVRYIQIEREGQKSKSAEPAQKKLPDQPLEMLDQQIVTQTSETIRAYTDTIAEHLAHYLQQQERPRDNKTIVFCVDNEHADKMRLALIDACAAWARPGDIVRIVDDDGPEGKRALNLFCASGEPQPMIVTTARLLTTGIDAPTCKNIVLARGVGSMVEFKQIIGRGTRIFLPQKGWFTILDYAGAIKHFFDAKFDGDPASMQREFLLPPAPAHAAEHQADEATPLTPATSNVTDQEQQPSVSIAPQTPLASVGNTNYSPMPEHDATSHTIHEQQYDATSSAQTSEVAPIFSTSFQNGADQPTPEPLYAPAEATNDVAASLSAAASATSAGSVPQASAVTPSATARPPRARASKRPTPAPQELLIVKKPDGERFIITREAYLELDANVRLREGTVSDFTQQALKDMIKTPDDLRQYWINKEERKLLIEQLTSEVVALDSLATALHMPDVDHFDLLLYVLFEQPTISRQERVERLRREHSAFFERFAEAPQANEFLNAILSIYIQEQDIDVRDLGLLKIAPLSSRTAREWNQILLQSPNQAGIQDTLQELQGLLYQ